MCEFLFTYLWFLIRSAYYATSKPIITEKLEGTYIFLYFEVYLNMLLKLQSHTDAIFPIERVFLSRGIYVESLRGALPNITWRFQQPGD